MLYNNQSVFTLESITDTLSNAISNQEQAMYAQLSKLQNNPNPSQQDLVIFQANLQIYVALLTMESSTIKVYGDTLKTITNNMGA